jgi:hypothetical protein
MILLLPRARSCTTHPAARRAGAAAQARPDASSPLRARSKLPLDGSLGGAVAGGGDGGLSCSARAARQRRAPRGARHAGAVHGAALVRGAPRLAATQRVRRAAR